MDRISQGIRDLLDRSPAGALPLSRLAEDLRREGVHPPNGEEGVARSAQGEGRLFRVLHPWRGPWSATSGPEPEERLAARSSRLQGEAWVLRMETTFPSRAGRGRVVVCLQESLQAWGRALDEEVPAAVARWIRAARATEETCSLLLTGATAGE